MSKATGWDYYLGIAGMNSVCQYLSTNCCKPLPTSLSQSDFQWLSLINSLQFPWCQIRAGIPTKQPIMLWGGCLVVPAGFSFPIGGTGSSEMTSSCGAALAWGRGNVINVQLLLTHLMQSILISVVQGVLQPYPNVLGFSHWYLILEHQLLTCSCKGV